MSLVNVGCEDVSHLVFLKEAWDCAIEQALVQRLEGKA